MERLNMEYSLHKRLKTYPNAPSLSPVRLAAGNRCLALPPIPARQPSLPRAPPRRHGRSAVSHYAPHRGRPAHPREAPYQTRLRLLRFAAQQEVQAASPPRVCGGVQGQEGGMGEVRGWEGGRGDEAVCWERRVPAVGLVEDGAEDFQTQECRVFDCAVCFLASGLCPFLVLFSILNTRIWS